MSHQHEKPVCKQPAARHMLIPMIIFGAVFSALLIGVTWLTAETWMVFSREENIGWLLYPIILVVSFVPLMFVGFFNRNGVVRVLSVISAVSLGFLNFFFFAALFCWLAYGAATLADLAPDMRLIAIVAYCIALLTGICGILNAAWLRTTRVTVSLPNLPDAWQDREIALVSDVHLGSILGAAFAGRIARRLQSLKPFAVFVSGDMFDGPEASPDRVLQPLASIGAPAGVYFVTGNHDEFSDRSPVLAAIERAGLRVLHNEKVCVEGMQILGVHDGETRNKSLYAELLRRMDISRDSPAILLVHQPDNLDIAAQAGVSLQLSGHTHGGQFWPWNLAVSRIYGSSAYGLSRIGSMQLFTSNGSGTWGPPMRVGTRSEVVVLHLKRA